MGVDGQRPPVDRERRDEPAGGRPEPGDEHGQRPAASPRGPRVLGRQRGKQARSLILHTPFPKELTDAIINAYQELCDRYGSDTDVAVRSSATAEDLPDASFAGQQETYLNVNGIQGVLEACRRCFASLFTDRAISYRQSRGYDHFIVALSVGVQKMVRSDMACSGVMFSIDTETGFKNAALISAAYGLG